MTIEIDNNSGFCFGVVNAITSAENELKAKGYVNSLGDIVHNKMEMNRLKALGLNSVTHETLDQAEGDTIFIRAHGEPPIVYDNIKRAGFKIVDATCPVVAKLQKRVKEAYNQMQEVNGQLILLGKRGHAEVVGLNGQVNNDCIVVENIEELLSNVDFNRPIYFLSQTTQPLALFEEMSKVIEQHTKDSIILDTICRNVSNREPKLMEFAPKFDVVFFIAGSESSNGKALYEVCRKANPNSYKIESSADIELALLEGVDSVGICGATSTPSWLMQRVADDIRLMTNL